MLGVIPVFLNSAGPFWASGEALTVIRDIGRLVKEVIPPGLLHVVTDFPEVADLSRGLGLHAHMVSDNPEKGSAVYPDHALSALKALEKQISEKDNVLVVGHRNPLLQVETLKRAVGEFRQGECERMVSMREVEHHPCQVKRYLSNQGFSVVHFLDSSPVEVAKCPGQLFRATYAFPMDWEGRGQNEDGCYRFDGEKYVPFTAVEMEDAVPDVIFERVGNLSRILYSNDFVSFCRPHIPKQMAGWELVGIGADPQGSTISTLVLREEGASRHAVVPIETAFPENGVAGSVMLVCLGASANGGGQACELELDAEYGASIFDLPENTRGCVVYHTRAVVQDSTYDSEQLWRHSGGLWEYVASRGRMVNKETDEAIAGRQWFPEVLEAEGSFCILSGGEVLAAVGEKESDSVVPFKLDCDECVHIESQIDYLDYIAAVRTREQGEAHA